VSAQDEQIRREVEASLKKASDQQLARIMQFIDRLPSRVKLDQVVEQVRGRLALVRPARSMTLLRVLTLPFEDLLVSPDLAALSPWCAPRDVVSVVGALTLTALSEAERRRMNAAADGRTMDEQSVVLALGGTLWPAGAAAIRNALKDGDAGDQNRRRILAGLADLLDYGEEIVSFMEQLPPRPMPRLREDERGGAMSLLFSLGQASPDLFRYAFTMLTRRSTEPMEFFDLLLNVDFGLPAEARDQILKEAAHECLHEVEVMGRDMETSSGRPVAAEADAALRMASLIESLENAPPQVKLNPKQLAETKQRASSSVVKSYQGALTGEMRATFDKVAGPSQSRWASDEEIAQAEMIARSTRKLGLAGDRLGAGPEVERAQAVQLSGYREQVVKKAGVAKGPRMARLAAVMDEVRLVELVFGSDAAGDLLRELEG
jgi:hypothetical protein